jgi:chorismate mutase/prephenate dehydratase
LICDAASGEDCMMSDSSDDKLSALRAQIDAIDAQLVELINRRAQVVVEVGKLKQQHNTPIYAPDREKTVLAKVRELNQGPLPHRSLEAVSRELMSGSFALEKPLRIGFLGPEGSFSHAAAVAKFGQSVDYVSHVDIPSVFDEVVRKHLDLGLVPVENSIHGGVVDTLDSFIASSAKICAEVNTRIHHNLLAKEPWEQIKRIYSKPEVFTQCRKWLSATAKGRDVTPVASTSAAAELASREPGSAAIGSALAGELYGLHVLLENIEDNPDNITRFFVIGNEPARRSGDDKTAIMFITAHKPGALAEVLDVFRDNGINLTDIEKRPSQKSNWQYCFFIDAQGHGDDEPVQIAIEQAKQHCLQLTVLGSYPRAPEVL